MTPDGNYVPISEALEHASSLTLPYIEFIVEAGYIDYECWEEVVYVHRGDLEHFQWYRNAHEEVLHKRAFLEWRKFA
jgi:hypothetical protein